MLHPYSHLHIDLATVLAVFAAGLLAGAINSLVGSGSLITFPTLLAVGLPALEANVANGIGLVFGSVSAAVGFRRELSGQARRAAVLAIPSALGGITGAILLLVLPPGVFARVVPVLVVVALVMVIAQPRLSRHLGTRPGMNERPWWLWVGMYGIAVYGGYFGAAQGVMTLSLLGIRLPDSLIRVNALKNVLVAIINGVAAVVLALLAPVSWPAVGLLAGSSIIGAQVGAQVGRRLPTGVLRLVIVVAGIVAVVKLVA